MVFIWLTMACDISGKWRDYSYNGSQIPANHCETDDNCWWIEQFTMELSEEFNGDFRIQIGQDNAHYIYTLPISAEEADGSWLFSVDNTDYQEVPEEWSCDKSAWFLICNLDGEEYQFRRGGFR